MVIISQYRHISNYHTGHLKHIQFPFVNYTSVKPRRKKERVKDLKLFVWGSKLTELISLRSLILRDLK